MLIWALVFFLAGLASMTAGSSVLAVIFAVLTVIAAAADLRERDGG